MFMYMHLKILLFWTTIIIMLAMFTFMGIDREEMLFSHKEIKKEIKGVRVNKGRRWN